MKRPHKFRHPKKAAMVAAFAQTGNISAAARAAGIDRTTHYTWLAKDGNYAAAMERAKEEAIEVLEAVARRRAIVGSDTMLIFLLKAARPRVYREYQHVEHTTDVDGIAAKIRKALSAFDEIHTLAEVGDAGSSSPMLPPPKEN